MTLIKPHKEVLESCEAKGLIIHREGSDVALALSLRLSSHEGRERLLMAGEAYERSSGNWSFAFANRYDVLRKLIDALLILERISTSNHQCANACLCRLLPSIQWEQIEKLRLMRNQIEYKGRRLAEAEYLPLGAQLEQLAGILDKELKKRIR